MLTLFRANQLYTLEQLKDVVRKYIASLPQKISSIGSSRKIFRFEFPCKDINILSWVSRQAHSVKTYWSDREKCFEMAGIQSADTLTSAKDPLSREVLETIEDRLSEGNPHLRYYGAQSFTSEINDPLWSKFGLYRFLVPQFEFYRSGSDLYFALNIVDDSITDEGVAQLLKDFDALDFSSGYDQSVLPELLERQDIPSKEEWSNVLSGVLTDISNNNYEKIVLARRSDFTFGASVEPFDLLGRLKDKTSHCYHFCFQIEKDLAFIGVSPERLYRRISLQIETEAIAGTRPRGRTEKEDTVYKQELLSSAKDKKEHLYVSEEIKNSLEPYCVKIDELDKLSLLELKGGYHLMTRFKGEVKATTSDHDLLSVIHPTPAVAGVPTKKVLQKIEETESFERGWYAAPVGYVGFDSVEFAVGIRCALVHKEQLSLYAGAGIIEGSDASDEWNEVEHKIEQFINIFDNEPSECKKS